jgi:peptidoglycan hydrolase-like protein with peptidoglycan-binding domain
MNKINSKVAAIAAAVAVVGLLGAASFAHAQTSTSTTTTTTTGSSMTNAQLAAEIASLQAQLAASQGTTMTTGSTPAFTMSLTIGSTGSQVSALQTWLIAHGYSIPAGATGYFGTETQAAVAAFQAANGITPDVGYFGPITMAKVNAMGGSMTTTTTTTAVSGCAPGAMYSSTTGQACGTTTTTTGTVSLSGSEGSINNFQTIGASNVTLGTGASQQVYGFQFQAGGSDLEVNRIYFDVGNVSASGTTRPWNIFDTATLTNSSGQTVATLDATNQNNWSEDGTIPSGTGSGNQIYRLDFEGVNQVVKEGMTQSYFLTLTTQSAFASGNSGGSYEVTLASQGLRATDAMGLQQYSPSNTGTFPGSGSTVTVNSNSTGSVTLSVGTDNPQTTTLMANQNTVTQAVVLNTFTLDNTGSASVELYTLPVTVTVAGTTTYAGEAAALIQDLKLYQGSTLLDTESPSSAFTNTGTISFKNLNTVIPAGTTDQFSVEADIQPVGGTNPAPSNSSVTVTVPGTGSDLEASGGAIIVPSGSSTGYPISFAVNGLSVASSPSSATASAVLSNGTGSQQTGTFTFVFNVSAFGQTIYVASTSNGYGLTVVDQTTGTATSTNVTSGITSSATRSGGGNFQVNSGQTATFTVTATLSNGGKSHYYYATLDNLSYATSDAGLNPATLATSTVTLPATYTTNSVSVSS